MPRPRKPDAKPKAERDRDSRVLHGLRTVQISGEADTALNALSEIWKKPKRYAASRAIIEAAEKETGGE